MNIAKRISFFILLFSATLFGSVLFAQNSKDTADGRFHDDFLNHLVGKWDVSLSAHGSDFTMVLEADWVMNHQYLHIHEKSREIVPWIGAPFESEFFIGYNHEHTRYVVHEMTVFGDDGPYEGFCYAYRSNNEIKLIKKWEANSDTVTIQRFVWEPISTSWHIEMRLEVAGKEGEILVDQKAVGDSSWRRKDN
jgi:hypothetical protein